MRHWVVAACMFALSACATPAEQSARPYAIASASEGVAPFVAQDDFFNALTPVDLSLRLKRSDDLSVEALRQLYAANVTEWNGAERLRLQGAFARLAPRLAPLSDWLPPHILVVKVTPELEGGIPHTRGAAISLGASLPGSDAELDETLLHETFHVLSRAHPERRDALYATIGFSRCVDVVLPPGVAETLITNPDAPLVQHGAAVSAAQPNELVTPLLLADPLRYDPAKPEIWLYFDLIVARLHRDAAGRCSLVEDAALSEEARQAIIYAHAGRNTNYLFHPEEILADNFAQMMMRRADAPNPEIYDRLAAVLGITRP